MDALRQWIEEELQKRGWRQADLAHQSGLAEATLSRILSGDRTAGPDACVALARAVDVPPERVFRLAGLLPPAPPELDEELELRTLFQRLDEGMRQVALDVMRVLGARAPRARGSVAEPRAETLSDRLARDIAQTVEKMPPQDQERVLAFLHSLQEQRGEAAGASRDLGVARRRTGRPRRGEERRPQETQHVPLEPADTT